MAIELTTATQEQLKDIRNALGVKSYSDPNTLGEITLTTDSNIFDESLIYLNRYIEVGSLPTGIFSFLQDNSLDVSDVALFTASAEISSYGDSTYGPSATDNLWMVLPIWDKYADLQDASMYLVLEALLEDDKYKLLAHKDGDKRSYDLSGSWIPDVSASYSVDDPLKLNAEPPQISTGMLDYNDFGDGLVWNVAENPVASHTIFENLSLEIKNAGIGVYTLTLIQDNVGGWNLTIPFPKMGSIDTDPDAVSIIRIISSSASDRYAEIITGFTS